MARDGSYLLMELARNRNDLDEQQAHRRADGDAISRRASGWPRRSSPAAICICCAAIMPTAVEYYSYLATHFPTQQECRGGALAGRLAELPAGPLRRCGAALRRADRLYPSATETVSALYWRGRLYETAGPQPRSAAANYRTIVRVYQHFFYAQMARQRLAALGDAASPSAEPQLDRLQPLPVPQLDGELSR